MSTIVYVNTQKGNINKASLEAVSYAAQMGGEVIAVQFGDADSAELGNYGADKVAKVASADFNPDQIARTLIAAADVNSADSFVLSHDFSGKAVAPVLSALANAGLVSGAVALPAEDGSIKKAVFSGKAFAHMKVNTPKKVISVLPNSIEKKEVGKSAAESSMDAASSNVSLNVKEQKLESADLPLTEADLVVSAGRGLKGPENWGMIEDLAKELGAATACSRPVSDMDWRPHHEHVGQTGVAIRPNLYIAVGISGAIQHLAGVNQSKVIVVINNDPEAPFFKSADYGIVGDAFEVVPKLVEKAKSMSLGE
ncbi:MAG: electron transfer flavoprotein subunit alpha [Flavobacteriales bacterium]|nr:electron transfer flavoprotein subunit alpha [Flavobacteriales bacterium]